MPTESVGKPLAQESTKNNGGPRHEVGHDDATSKDFGPLLLCTRVVKGFNGVILGRHLSAYLIHHSPA